MEKKSKIRAEEVLAAENFSDELLLQNEKGGKVEENETRIVRDIYSFLRNSSGELTHSEKEQTKNQIKFSIRKLTIRRLMVRWSVAATLLTAAILTSIGYFRANSSTEIVQFAQTLDNIKAGNSTRIILRNGEEVLIDKKVSQIKYDAKGENILIDSEQKIAQTVNETKAVYNTVIVPNGKRSQITLSEGTKVWLNSGSKLIYPAMFAENKREVYIDGEAVFDVTHMKDKPFVVSTKDFDIKVLGTVFNVNAYSDDQNSSTVLEEGKIELVYSASILSKEKLDITPGTMAVYDRKQKTISQQKVNPQKYLSWREGYLTLNSEKLNDILKKLSRYYNIEMVITDERLKNQTFSGYLDLKNSPEEVLSVINETTSLSYTTDHEKIFINPK
ncbi:MAG: FecR domain-containing protein [Bacteroidia bacterium]|nr:FecR domain-containing protein [Bacteroidia bacterium]